MQQKAVVYAFAIIGISLYILSPFCEHHPQNRKYIKYYNAVPSEKIKPWRSWWSSAVWFSTM